MKLILTGFIQVFFVSLNTYFIAKGMLLGVFMAGFTISFVWSWNIKKVAFGGLSDRLFYSLGAAIGSLSGAFVGTLIH